MSSESKKARGRSVQIKRMQMLRRVDIAARIQTRIAIAAKDLYKLAEINLWRKPSHRDSLDLFTKS